MVMYIPRRRIPTAGPGTRHNRRGGLVTGEKGSNFSLSAGSARRQARDWLSGGIRDTLGHRPNRDLLGKFQFVALKARQTVGRAHEPADQVAVLKKSVIDKYSL